jgi:hypothetical protein
VLNVLSLFTGIGGLDLGLERAGMRVVGQVEIDPYCQQVLAKHWPEVPQHDDVRTAPAWWRSGAARPAVHVVAGGFPCSSDLSSWRTSQTSLPIEMPSAACSVTWPTSGSMRNGRCFPHAPWVPHTHGNGCSLWPTPRAAWGRSGWDLSPTRRRYNADTEQRLRGLIQSTGSWRAACGAIEWLMGLPPEWTDVTPSATPSSPRSPSTPAD